MAAPSDARAESGGRELLSMAAHGFTSLGVTLYWISGLLPVFWGLVSGFNAVICYAIHAGLIFSLQKHWTLTANKLWNCIRLYEEVFVFTYYVWLKATMNTVKGLFFPSPGHCCLYWSRDWCKFSWAMVSWILCAFFLSSFLRKCFLLPMDISSVYFCFAYCP